MGWRPYSSSACLLYTALLGLAGWILLDVGAKSLDMGKAPQKDKHSPGDIAQGLQPKQEVRRSGSPLVNPHDFHMIINIPRFCDSGTDPVKLLVTVASAPQHLHQRAAIRDTWGNANLLQLLQVKLVFLLANPYDSRVQTQVTEESRSYGDILQEDFKDSYLNLTLKTVMGLKWAHQHCPQAQFFMKTDDDMYVNLPHLLDYLGEEKRQRWVGGCIKQRKAFLPVNAPAGMPMPQAHPDFVAGAGYVISGDIVAPLYSSSLRRRIIPVEDVYVTGHLAATVGAHPPHHDERFSCGELVPHDCLMVQLFTGHKISPTRMKQIWGKLDPNTINSPCRRR
ncbi:unnamed protein product [Meganyctiphanes norvegica]|uniref:Hexosyltransferase n=1 Tax=Meganyctiphanes norvegica TaxID=48144 RepID=A0AAV2REW6_MEGNR